MTYPPPTDYSDRLARVNCQLQILMDLAPFGEWKTTPLIQKWETARYTFTLSEFKELEAFLAQTVTEITEDPTLQIGLPSGSNPNNS